MNAGFWVLASLFVLLFTYFGHHISRNLAVLGLIMKQQTEAIYELTRVQKARGRLERDGK